MGKMDDSKISTEAAEWLFRVEEDPRLESSIEFLGCGTEDSLFTVNKQFSEQLTNAGIEHTFHSSPGAHTPATRSCTC